VGGDRSWLCDNIEPGEPGPCVEALTLARLPSLELENLAEVSLEPLDSLCVL
jgi:hypothetical protein